MLKKPLISIIVPIYNVEAYLKECVDSILNQSYRNLEIILVNDGSPDNCGNICDEYAKLDSRIIVIHKTNGGLSDARNAGLDIANGDYIAFVDSDDVLHPYYINELFDAIGNADMAFCNFHPFKNDISEIPELDLNTNSTTYSGDFLLANIHVFNVPLLIIAWNKLSKKNIWNGLRFPVARIHEDEFIIHHLLDRCKNIVFLALPLYFYRQRDESIMNIKQKSIKSLTDRFDAIDDRINFFKQKNYSHLIGPAYQLKRSFFLNVDIDNRLNLWKEYTFFSILNDSISFKLKFKLLLKKLAPNFYKKIQGNF